MCVKEIDEKNHASLSQQSSLKYHLNVNDMLVLLSAVMVYFKDPLKRPKAGLFYLITIMSATWQNTNILLSGNR